MRDSKTTPPPPGVAGGPYPDEPLPRRSSGGSAVAWAIAAVVILGLLAWALWATFADDDSAGPEAGVTLQQVASDPAELAGSQVVVSGQIADVLTEEDVIGADLTGPSAFILGEDGEVLVVGVDMPEMAALAGNEEIAEGDVVQVSGTVHAFDAAAFEEELGAELDEGLYEPFAGRPAITATDVDLVPVTAAAAGEDVRVTLEALRDDPQAFLGQQVQVGDATVEQVLSPRVVALSDDLVAILPAGQAGQVDPGATVQLDGTVVETSTARLANELNLDAGGDGLFEELGIEEPEIADYEAAIVASGINPAG
jgi:hypothetical protein